MSTNFKTCLFGGFDKRDVISFIEKTAQENSERIRALETENDALKEKNGQMDTELRLMREDYAQKCEKAKEAVTLAAQLAEAKAHLEDLERKNAALQVQADEYQSIKDHIAEIEISAHRRTEQFRAQAIAQLREVIGAQKAWCTEASSRYAAMNATVMAQMQQAMDFVSQSDFSCFDEMTCRLQQISDSFDEPQEEKVVEEEVTAAKPMEAPVEEIPAEEPTQEAAEAETVVVEEVAEEKEPTEAEIIERVIETVCEGCDSENAPEEEPQA